VTLSYYVLTCVLTLTLGPRFTALALKAGANPIADIHGYDQHVDIEAVWLVDTYGTYGLGLDLTAAAWPGLHQVFTGGDPKLYDYVARPACSVIDDVRRLAKGYLTAHPVDLLLLGNMDALQEKEWLRRIPSQDTLSPSLVVEYWEPWHIMTEDGPMSKGMITKWEKLAYSSTCCTANGTRVGGVVD
jgi:hypothetical protein